MTAPTQDNINHNFGKHGPLNPPLKTPSSNLSNEIGGILNNYAVCRSHIGGKEYMKSGDFEAHMVLCFGGHDRTKRPIDDLTTKATQALTTLFNKQIVSELRQLEPPVEYVEYARLMGSDSCRICGFNAVLFRKHIEDRIKELGGAE